MFCFAHLFRFIMDGHPIFQFMVDTGCTGIHHSKYWMPIHYDTIEDGQNKTSHRFFSNYFLCLFSMYLQYVVSFPFLQLRLDRV